MKNEEKRIDQLIELASGGDDGAFAELSEVYAPMLKAACAQYLDEMGQDAYGELWQEALLALHRALSTYDAEKGVSFGLYAKICANNALISYVAQATRRRGRADYVPIDELPELQDLENDPTANERYLETYREIVAKLYGILSEFELRAFVLHINGMTVDEISSELGRKRSAVESAVSRARKKARTSLKL